MRVSPERIHLECERQRLTGWGSELNEKGKRGARCALAGVHHTDVYHTDVCTGRCELADVYQQIGTRCELAEIHHTDMYHTHVHRQICTDTPCSLLPEWLTPEMAQVHTPATTAMVNHTVLSCELIQPSFPTQVTLNCYQERRKRSHSTIVSASLCPLGCDLVLCWSMTLTRQPHSCSLPSAPSSSFHAEPIMCSLHTLFM